MRRLLFAVSVLFFVFMSLVPGGLAAPLSNSPRPGYPSASVRIMSLASGGGQVFVAAEHPILYSKAKQFAFNQLTGNLTDWNPHVLGGISNIVVTSNLVYLCGRFGIFEQGPNGERIRRTFVASVDARTGTLTQWNPVISGFQIEGWAPSMLAIAIHGDVAFVGGEFTTVSGSNRINVAAIDRTTGLATPWTANIQMYAIPDMFTVKTLAVHAGDLIVGGHFVNVGGQSRTNWQSRTNLAIIDGTTGLFKPFNLAPISITNHPGMPGDNGWVRKVAVHNDVLYVAGNFSLIGDKPRAGLAAIDLETETVTDWDPQIVGEVRDFAFGPDAIYLGGQFTSVGTSNRANLAAVNYATGKALAWNPAPNGAVNAMILENGRLFVGGEFTQVGTNALSYLAVFAQEGSFWFGGGNVVGSEFQGQLFGEEGKNYIIEGSTDFGAWQEIARGTPVNGGIPFSDPVSTSGKFYRSRLIE